MAKEAFNAIMAGLLDALAYAKGDKTRGTVHTPTKLEGGTMSNKQLFDNKAAKPATCWRIDPETGKRLELVTKKNLVRTESWDELRKQARV